MTIGTKLRSDIMRRPIGKWIHKLSIRGTTIDVEKPPFSTGKLFHNITWGVYMIAACALNKFHCD